MAETTKKFLQQNLLQDLNSYLEALLRPGAAGTQHVALAEPPHFSPEAKVARIESLSLSEMQRYAAGILFARWPRQQLNSIRYPFLGLVIEGEVEVPIGTPAGSTPSTGATPTGAKSSPESAMDVYALRVAAPNCLLVPPGVPHHDGTRPFWKHVATEQRQGRVLWIHLLPAGAICHSYTVRGWSQETSPYLFVTDAHLAIIAELMLSELRERNPSWSRATTAYLTALLTRIERALQSSESSVLSPDEDRFPILPARVSALPTAIVGRACHYVQTHLREPLSPNSIAREVHVSPAHLNRLFRADAGVSVMEYVRQCRRENAESLLQNTDLTIAQIGQLVGYPDPAHFAHAFSRWTNQSPRAFRQNGETDKSIN